MQCIHSLDDATQLQASHLEALQHCKMATTESLLEVLQVLDGENTLAYRVGDPRGIVNQIDKHMGLA